MVALTYEEIRAKIKDATGVSESEIDNKVSQKLKQLSDLISKEGAAHIVANDMGVKIFQQQKHSRQKINEVMPMQRNVEVLARVVRNYGTRNFKTEKKEGRVASFLMGDETGVMRATVWDEPVIQQLADLKDNDIVLIKGAYVKENNGFKELHLGSGSSLQLNPANETVGFSKQAPSNKTIAELKEKDLATVTGTVVQLFEPRFYEACVTCGKKVQEDGTCSQHGKTEKRLMPVVNIILDDGTDNIRIVFFRDLAESLIGLKSDELAKARENPTLLEDLKKTVLGKQVQITGRVNMNEMFARLEMVAQNVKEATPEDVVAVVKQEEVV
ncbi:MAG TPA: hypothetical protein HA362_07840 [Nanoarchaeota archaeon]|nr:hypothetical protein [Nanoarchaeota archaeon]